MINQSLGIKKILKLCIILIIVKLILSSIFQLVPEEAYYWEYSRHYALSYYDHPGGIAWLIAIGEFIFGHSEIGVRIFPILFTVIIGVFSYKTGKLLWGERAGIIAVVITLFNPLIFLMTFLAKPDAPLLVCWAVCIYYIAQIYFNNASKTYVIMAALFLGLGLLSKYTMILIIPGLILFEILEERKDFLKLTNLSKRVLGIGIVFIIISPIIIWNYQHDWASFTFQFSRRFQNASADVFKFRNIIRTLGSFIGALSPFLFILSLFLVKPLIKAFLRDRDARRRIYFILFVAIPLIAMFFKHGLKENVHIDWWVPGIYTICLLISGCINYILEKRRDLFYRISIGGGILQLSLILIFLMYFIYVIPQKRIIEEVGGWKEIASEVKQLADRERGNIFYLGAGRAYTMASELGFYLNDSKNVYAPDVYGHSGLNFEYWTDLQSLKGKTGIICYYDANRVSRDFPSLKARFEKLRFYGTIEVMTSFGVKREFIVIIGENYKPIKRKSVKQ